MNKIYNLVWNAVIGCWLVASELARKGKTGRGARCLIIAYGLMAVSGSTLAVCTPEINASASGEIKCTGGDIKVEKDWIINADFESGIIDYSSDNANMINNGKINGKILLYNPKSRLENNGSIYGQVGIYGGNPVVINNGVLDNESDIIFHGPEANVRIPLYSITDWHRSPISDSHTFDQPGT
ncbi:hypothetical protein DBU35_004748 [Escherichia coli O20]|nr:hypothetical protein [Escherichia coli O20]